MKKSLDFHKGVSWDLIIVMMSTVTLRKMRDDFPALCFNIAFYI